MAALVVNKKTNDVAGVVGLPPVAAVEAGTAGVGVVVAGVPLGVGVVTAPMPTMPAPATGGASRTLPTAHHWCSCDDVDDEEEEDDDEATNCGDAEVVCGCEDEDKVQEVQENVVFGLFGSLMHGPPPHRLE